MMSTKQTYHRQGKHATKPIRRGDYLFETQTQQDNSLLPTTTQQAIDRFQALLGQTSPSPRIADQKNDVTRKKTLEERTRYVEGIHREQPSTGRSAHRFSITTGGIKLPTSTARAGAAEGITFADSDFATTGSSSVKNPDARELVYKELQAATDFRLIRVLPNRGQGLKCEIVHSSLLHPPDYIAISYAWGDGFDKRKITLEGLTHISVNANLYDALVAIREPDHAVLVWIDGLSIDQENKVERSKQVQLMDKIYRQATCVAVWLGPEVDDSGQAIQLIEKLGAYGATSEWTSILKNDDYKALHTLFRRNYWSRLWVVQEVFYAQSKIVYCGSSKLPWDSHKRASDTLWEHESDRYLWTGPSSFPDVHRLMALGPNSLLEVLRACRRKLSDNPRDKIFGVLGILPQDIRERLHVSYDKTVKSLYLEVTQIIVRSTHRLDVMREAIHYPVQVSFTDLPTWCPNWTQVPENSALSSKNFSAAGDSDAEYEFKDEMRKLEISAVELDIIDTTGVAVGTLCSLQDYLMAFLNWRMLLLDEFGITEDEEPDHPRVDDFCKTLSLGQPLEKLENCWTKACYCIFSSWIQERFPRLQLDSEFKNQGDSDILQLHELRPLIQKHFGDRMMGRTFCITKNGMIGMGTGFMGREDIVVVPFGCSTPVILRAEGENNEYRYVGDVYIHGYMHGEALDSDKPLKPVKKYTLH